ncbi:MAG: hypothetical protein HKL89_08720, partial [Candidatus Dormibacteraeota bacterium]|nr:hypothetical protein [Candidatus Dormibacteraeota bacterium]
ERARGFRATSGSEGFIARRRGRERVARNPRARSALLRTAVKLPTATT